MRMFNFQCDTKRCWRCLFTPYILFWMAFLLKDKVKSKIRRWFMLFILEENSCVSYFLVLVLRGVFCSNCSISLSEYIVWRNDVFRFVRSDLRLPFCIKRKLNFDKPLGRQASGSSRAGHVTGRINCRENLNFSTLNNNNFLVMKRFPTRR